MAGLPRFSGAGPTAGRAASARPTAGRAWRDPPSPRERSTPEANSSSPEPPASTIPTQTVGLSARWVAQSTTEPPIWVNIFIVPVSQAARLVTTLHMIFTVALVGAALRLITLAARHNLSRRGGAAGPSEASGPPLP